MDMVLSVGGSIIVPDEVDTGFLKKFREIILNQTDNRSRIAIIAGGGSVCRKYIGAAQKIAGKIKDNDLDWVGIRATMVNAELLRAVFSEQAHPEIISDPTQKISLKHKIIIGSGWKPGFSSDMDAVLLAKNLKIKTVINLTNIDYVYTADPKKDKSAQPIKEMSWSEMQKIVGDKWIPGSNLPFDPIASKEASKAGLKVIIMNGKDLNNFKKFLNGKEFKGTVIS